MRKKSLCLLLVLAMLFCLCIPALAEDDPAILIAPAPAADAAEDGIVILYTNDVHTYVDQPLTYASIAALKQSYQAAGNGVLLVDAGDHVQGTAYGSMDKGETIISLMNAAGYDAATLGNHEFDYAMAGTMNVISWAEYPYLSCNFYHEEAGVPGENVLDAYKVFEFDGVKVAIIGITTPESFTKSTPAYFQNEAGEYIYGIAGGEDGSALYAAVQTAIDAASAEADYIIALGHLGDDPSSDPWNSEDVIANTTGLDAFIDGHSHSTIPMKAVADKEGASVVLTSTGDYFNAIGKMVIHADGTITSGLFSAYEGVDESVKALSDEWIAKIADQLGEVIGVTECTLDNYDADGNRLVRKSETNSGDFAADALYYLFDNMGLDVDIAMMNGGGVRNKAITGEISYLTCKDMHTFGNVACLQTITGQQMLDALEWGARDVTPDGIKECGGFLQVSGLTYEIHSYIEPTVQADEKGVWVSGPTGEYRVQNVQVLNRETGVYEPLDLEATYNLAGYNYTLRDLGDGYAMFDGAVNVLDYVAEDYMVLANYVKSFPKNEAGLSVVTGYDEVTGAGRIKLVNEAPAETPVVENTSRAAIVNMLWQLDGGNCADYAMSFSDVEEGMWYTEAIRWAASEGIVLGYDDGTYKPDKPVTREEVATILYRYAQKKGEGFTGSWMFLLPFEDGTEISDWANEAVHWCYMKGIILGRTETTFVPRDTATIEEAGLMIGRLSESLAK